MTWKRPSKAPEITRSCFALSAACQQARAHAPGEYRLSVEHAKTKLIYAVPAGELNPEFFISIQEQLSVLVGGPKKAAEDKPAEPTPAVEPAAEVPTP